MGDRAIGEAGVGINKQEEVALGFFGELMAGPRLSSPTFREGLTLEEADTGVSLGSTLDEGGGAVGGVVVENKNLHIRVVAVGDGTDAWGKAVLLVAGRNKN